jgi:hypothetical protein
VEANCRLLPGAEFGRVASAILYQIEGQTDGLDGRHGGSLLFSGDRYSLLTFILTYLDRLHQAVNEYDQNRWRIVSGTLGNGFSDAACEDKFNELNGLVTEHHDSKIDEDSGSLPVGA